jgi:hypothetical protein
MRSKHLPLLLGLLFSGCSLFSGGSVANQEPAVTQSLHDQFKDKRFITLVYESVMKKETTAMENAFRFQQSSRLDEALIELNRKVSDRGTIQAILESQHLPESGTFASDDLTKIGKLSGADILLLGYYATTVKDGFIYNTNQQKLVLRAIDLHTLAVINSVQVDNDGESADKQWKKLVHVLFRLK